MFSNNNFQFLNTCTKRALNGSLCFICVVYCSSIFVYKLDEFNLGIERVLLLLPQLFYWSIQFNFSAPNSCKFLWELLSPVRMRERRERERERERDCDLNI